MPSNLGRKIDLEYKLGGGLEMRLVVKCMESDNRHCSKIVVRQLVKHNYAVSDRRDLEVDRAYSLAMLQ